MNKFKNILSILVALLLSTATFSQFLNDANETVLYTNKSVGIGTSTPSSQLQIGHSTQNSDCILRITSSGFFKKSLQFYRNGNIDAEIYEDASENFNLYNYYPGRSIIFGTESNERMRIYSNGNVGIGVSIPNEKLEVNGNIKATTFNGDWDGSNISKLLYKGTNSEDWNSMTNNNGIVRMMSSINNPFGGTHATLLNIGVNDGNTYGFQIVSDSRTLKFRGFTENGVFNEWQDIYHSGNFNKSILDESVPNLAYTNKNNNFGANQTFNGQINVIGNVGIGIDIPNERLEVNGTVKAISFKGDWNGSNISNLLYIGDNSEDWNSMTNKNGIFRMMSNSNNPFGGTHATLLNIGVNNGDTYGFQVISDSRTRLKFRGFTENGVFNQWYDIYHSGNFNKNILDETVPNLVYSNISNSFYSNQIFNGSITVTDNLGIGTEAFSSDYKLAVDGKILTKGVKVSISESDWSDFVFADDYKLQTLSEVESFIEENNHLPQIPSAQEVGEQGVDLGQMDAKLLQKIEELTLYLIEQNKEIEKLKEEVKQLKAEE